jgi:hypothetical protein
MGVAMFVRVTLRHVGQEGDRCRFDLSLGPDLIPLADKVYFGFWGSLDGIRESFGVALTPEGLINLGAGFETEDRLHKTNLHQRKIEIGQYVTIWWQWGGRPQEHTYIIEAMLQLSALTELVTVSDASNFLVPKLAKLPRFRARVVRSFEITGYDGVVYLPPVGVEGDIGIFQDLYVFCPDNAVAKNGDLITVVVEENDLEMILDSGAV